MACMSLRLSSVRPTGVSVAPRRAAPKRVMAAPRAAVATGNIVETAKAAGSFNTLITALTATGLDSALTSGNFTVFAPTDAAFAKLPAGTVEALLKDKTRLSQILSFHVIKGKTLSKHIINGSGQMPTLCELPDPKVGTWKVTLVVDHKENGKKGAALKVGQNCAVVQGLEYEVRGAKVEKADIECSNGVIHVIDSVMIPDVKFCGV